MLRIVVGLFLDLRNIMSQEAARDVSRRWLEVAVSEIEVSDGPGPGPDCDKAD
jgi:hypothetical protein